MSPVKDHQARTVPIPRTVVDELTDLQAQSAPSELVFPSANSTPPRPRTHDTVWRRSDDVGFASGDVGAREPVEGERADVVAGLLAVIEVAHDLPGGRAHQEAMAGVAGGDE